MLTPALSTPLIATLDPRLTARVISRRPMYYAEGADPAQDRPAHLRAASAIVGLSGERWAVVQDDALFLAVLAGRGGEIDAGATPIALEAPDGVRLFDDGRGNKKAKADLEAACRWVGPGGAWLVGFGSGSTARRERLLIAPEADLAAARLVEAPGLYAQLRSTIPAGAELNIEGALQIGPPASGALRLIQRGNGIGGVDAAIDVAAGWLDALLRAWSDGPGEMAQAGARAPEVLAAARWELGKLGGVRLTFTDGTPSLPKAALSKTTPPAADSGRWLFSAAAEASPDAIGDGPVAGSAIGWAGESGGAWAPLVGEDGEIVACKLEGIAVEGRDGGGWRLLGVVDADDPERPSELLTLRLEGPWAGG